MRKKLQNDLMILPPAVIEESVSNRNYDKNEKYDEEKEAECPYDTSPIKVEEGVSDRNDDKNEKYDEDKEAECPDETSQ